jgi:hypothetical protein
MEFHQIPVKERGQRVAAYTKYAAEVGLDSEKLKRMNWQGFQPNATNAGLSEAHALTNLHPLVNKV